MNVYVGCFAIGALYALNERQQAKRAVCAFDGVARADVFTCRVVVLFDPSRQGWALQCEGEAGGFGYFVATVVLAQRDGEAMGKCLFSSSG